MSDNVSWVGAKPHNLQTAEHSVITWHVQVPADMPFDEVLKPDFWTHVAGKMRPGQRVIVDSIDFKWTATLFVRSAQRLSAVVSLIEKHDFKDKIAHPAGEMNADDYEVSFAPSHRHRVVRISDKTVLKKDFQTADEASEWLRDYLKRAA
jgi:hypothetical protein